LIALAESYAEDYWGEHQARKLLLRVLELEPQNPIARQQLAFLFERRGVSILQWGQATQALAIFKEGLELVPDNQRLLVLVGGVYVGTGEHDKGRPYFEKALTANPNDLQTLYTVYLAWLNADSQADVDQTFERIKAIRGPIPGSFFIDLINRCLEAGQEKQAMALIDYVEAHYQDDEQTLLMLASLLSDVEQEGRALALLRKILKESPDHAEANLQLGTLYFEMGQTRLAKRHWQKAEQQARKENNQMLLYQLKMTRDTMLYGKQPPRNMFDMLRQMPPELRQQLFEGAPPEIAGMLQNMDLETLEMLMGFAMDDDLGTFDFFDDEDDDYYV
jgi:tetratricopeptide (TPR) repeat protein